MNRPVLLLLTFIAVARTAAGTEIEQTTLSEGETDPYTYDVHGLSMDEWERYSVYMEGEGKYHYPHLDPVFVSGLIAETHTERRKFAELYALQEHDRTQRLIQFERVYREAFNDLFGPLAAHDSARLSRSGTGSGATTGRTLQSFVPGDRITLFVSRECDACVSAFNRIKTTTAQQVGIAIDIYFVGDSVSANDIRTWATEADISAEDVSRNTITLNFDDRFALFNHPPIPSAWHVRGSTVVGEL